jgi:AraC-like DNA-binding protein
MSNFVQEMDFIAITQFIILFISTIFSIHLFFTSGGHRLLNRLLSLVFAGRLFHTLFFLQVTTFQGQFSKPFMWVVPAFVLLSPAIFYLYIRTYITGENKLDRRDLLHLSPLSILILQGIIFRDSGDHLQSYLSHHLGNFEVLASFFSTQFIVITYIRAILYLIYLVFSWKLIHEAYKEHNESTKGKYGNWLILFTTIISILHSLVFISLTLVGFNILPPDIHQILDGMALFGTVTTFGLMLYALAHPELLQGSHISVQSVFSSEESMESASAEAEKKSIKKQLPYTEEQVSAFKQLLEEHMVTNKPYLNPDYSLRQLAEELQLSEHHCSSMLNQFLETNFREYINHYRVQYFIHVYAVNASKFTLESVALSSGFKSKNTFYTAFKKVTGQTPTEFLSNYSSM